MAARLFTNQVLTTSFVASKVFAISGERITVDWLAVVTTAPTEIQWYFEFGSDLTNFFREVDEEDLGDGNVDMSKVVRSFKENGGALLAAGTHRLSTQFVRRHQFCRMQARIVAGGGAATITVDERFGLDVEQALV